MPESLTIVLSILGACTAFGAGACKYYTDRNNQQENEVVVVQTEKESIENDHTLEDLIAASLQERNSDRDSEIEINIHIHAETHERK